jgi:uncharacterized protein YheU (UPF0270 family)
MNDNDGAAVTEVPYTALQPGTLRALIEEFVTRDTTDYGERERMLQDKVEDVMRQLQRGEAQIVFDGASGTINIVVAPDSPATTQTTSLPSGVIRQV